VYHSTSRLESVEEQEEEPEELADDFDSRVEEVDARRQLQVLFVRWFRI